MNTTNRKETCPTLDELRAQLEKESEAISRHLETCRRCLALLRLLAEEATPREPERTLEADNAAEDRPATGSKVVAEIGEGAVIVVSTPEAPGELLLAVVLDTESEAAGSNGLVVAPLTTEIAFATDADVVLEPNLSPLPYTVMAEIWNEGVVLRGQVEEQRGLVEASARERIIAIFSSTIDDDDGSWQVAPNQERLGDGPAILDDADPRLLFQDEEIERAELFYIPAARVLFGEHASDVTAGETGGELLTVGGLLSQWLDEQGYDPSDYASQIGFDLKHVELVRLDKIDPSLGSERVAQILSRPYRDTGIDLDDLDRAMGRSFDEDADWNLVGASTSGRIFARTSGRRGHARSEAMRRRLTGTTSAISPEEVERRKRAFINDVLAALEEKPGQ